MNLLQLASSSVPSLHTQRHAWLMYGLVRWLRPLHIVEVGAWNGFCTMHLAQACQDNGFGHVTVIDDYSLGSAASEIHNNLQKIGLADRVTLLSGKSSDVAWPKRVDFAFIDGDHSYNGCTTDCNKAIEAGAECVCVHDTVSWWGPKGYSETVREVKGDMWDLIEGNFDCGFMAMVKRHEKSPLTYTELSHPEGRV